MKRVFYLLLVLVFVFSSALPAFADGDVLYCRICGRQIPTDSRICPYCGEAVVHVRDSADADAAPAQAGSAPTQPASPATQSAQPAEASAPVPGPFNTVLGQNNTSRVRVTKSPTSESVPYGGSCLFIAHAVNAESVCWYLANADATAIIPAADASAYCHGLTVTGYSSDTLSLSGIPSDMNGFQVQACFEGEGGPVYTEIARIWTYAEPAPQKPPCWNPWLYYAEYGYLWGDPCLQPPQRPPEPILFSLNDDLNSNEYHLSR